MNYSKLIVIFLITCQSTKCLGQVFEDENMPGAILLDSGTGGGGNCLIRY
jgi:hypothetical protein